MGVISLRETGSPNGLWAYRGPDWSRPWLALPQGMRKGDLEAVEEVGSAHSDSASKQETRNSLKVGQIA